MNVEHVFGSISTLGGVETLLRLHRDRDGARFRLLWEKSKGDPRVLSCGSSRWVTPAHIRRTAARCRFAGTAVYHNGLDLLAGSDGAARRIFYIHALTPFLETQLRRTLYLCDGVFCVSKAIEAQLRAWYPEYEARRIAWLPLPAPEGSFRARPEAASPLRLAYCGRIVQAQKRLDRLPLFLQALRDRNIGFEFHLAGHGSFERRLRRALAGMPEVVSHGSLHGPAYRQLLEKTDALVFFSDFEGLPLTFLEAARAGVPSLFPAIACDAVGYLRRAAPGLVYAAGDMGGAADAAKRLADFSGEERARIATSLSEAVAEHCEETYLSRFRAHLENIADWPRISPAAPRRPRLLSDHLPCRVLERFAPTLLYCPSHSESKSRESRSANAARV